MDLKDIVLLKRLRKLTFLACVLVALVALTGCESAAKKAENEFDVKILYSQVYSGEELQEWEDPYPEDWKYIDVAAVVTSNSDIMYSQLILEPIAYELILFPLGY